MRFAPGPRFALVARAALRRPAATVASLSVAWLAACSSDGPTVLTIDRTSYPKAFEAAVTAVREAGMVTALRDREGGVIETAPRRAGTLLEPWRVDNSGIGQATENTVDLRRRRVRFEFVSTDFAPTVADPAGTLHGPDLLGERGTPETGPLSGTAPIELRAWVFIEQGFTPGLRRMPWTQRMTTQSFDPEYPIDPAEGVLSSSIWTPISRDDAFERRLLADVRRRLGEPAAAPAATPVEPVVPR